MRISEKENSLRVLRATSKDSSRLSQIAWEAKKHWGYPAAWMEGWKNDLSPDTSYVEDNHLLKVEEHGELLGWGALCFDQENQRWEIGHLWILPKAMGRGLGKLLWETLCMEAKKRCVQELFIYSDPNAQAFYEKMGADFIEDVPSTPEGRTIPLMRYHLV